MTTTERQAVIDRLQAAAPRNALARDALRVILELRQELSEAAQDAHGDALLASDRAAEEELARVERALQDRIASAYLRRQHADVAAFESLMVELV